MEVGATKENSILILKPEGSISGLHAQEFHNAFEKNVDDDTGFVVVNFRGVGFISSAGLRVLLLMGKTLPEKNANIKLCGLSDSIKEIFAISGFDKIMSVYDSEAEAKAACAS